MSGVTARKNWRPAVVAVFALAALVLVGWPIGKRLFPRSRPEISFSPVPLPIAQAVRADITPDTLIGFVDVRRIDFALGRRDDLADAVWESFANNPHEQSFGNVVVTKDSFASTLATYQDALVQKAIASGLPDQTLRASLDSIEPTGWLAVLPVGAYLATYDGDDIWILVCKWEGMSPDRPTHLSHVRVWALRAADQTVLAFRTCG